MSTLLRYVIILSYSLPTDECQHVFDALIDEKVGRFFQKTMDTLRAKMKQAQSSN